jgi:hypothetical protein
MNAAPGTFGTGVVTLAALVSVAMCVILTAPPARA